MYEVAELTARLNPRQTLLLLGAGASVPSGAPSGEQLSRQLATRLRPNYDVTDYTAYSLSELCSIFERKTSRRQLAEAVADILRPVEPTKGIQLLPRFEWYRIYSTNFDLLVEKVFALEAVPLRVLRSNFDFSSQTRDGAVEYYKIHGCITQDVGFGDQTRMLLTEEDYETYPDFREASFRTLSADMLTKDALIVGQSLADIHLRDLVRDVLRIQRNSGAPGRVFVLSYSRDEDRAEMMRSRGAEVFFGGLDDFFAALLNALPEEEVDTKHAGLVSGNVATLPPSLVSVTTDVRHAVTLAPNARMLFNGSAATYADIGAGYTFPRTASRPVLKALQEKPIAVILGAGGVGKTTLARQIAMESAGGMAAAWEHTNSFPLDARSWIVYEQQIRATGERAALLVDDCVENLAQVSQICTHLGMVTNPALQLVLTANTGLWSQRSKSRYIFSHGEAFQITLLTAEDIGNLLDLMDNKPAIRELVESRFLNLSRAQQSRILRERCAADMYVCMKNIFASEELDFILLREFAELSESAQEIYRNVSALDATGARVHRQLVMRCLGVEAGGLSAVLESLAGVVSEFDIDPANGLFGWETRHREVARTIAKFKFAAQDELKLLFEAVIDSINPSVWLEKETAKALCTSQDGIEKLADPATRIDLLGRIVRVLPGESIPRHRLIRHLIDDQQFDVAARELRSAADSIRMNPVLGRYEILLAIRQAQLAPGLLDEDRVALLLGAQSLALINIRRYATDLHAYRIYGDVAIALAFHGGGTATLVDAIELAREAESNILDPALGEARRRMEDELRRMS